MFTCADRVRAIAFGGHAAACELGAVGPLEPRDVVKPPRSYRWASLAMESQDSNKSFGLANKRARSVRNGQ